MTRTVYSIRNWNEHFEIAQSRKIDGPMSWVAMPCKHDGLGFRKIMRFDDGPSIYGAWVLIVQVAAKCPRRGVLCDADGPLDAGDLSLKTGCHESVFVTALKVLSSKEIGWIVVGEWDESPSTLPPQNRTEQDTTEQDKTGCVTPAKPTVPPSPASDPSAVDFPEFPCIPGKRTGGRTWLLTEAHMRELASSFPALDVPQQCRQAHSWIRANLDRRKTAGGMPDFLFRWMVREQNSGRSKGNGVGIGTTHHPLPKAPPRSPT